MSRFTDSAPDHDAFWIVALWRALHGGDALLGDVAAAVIANLSRFLPACPDTFGLLPPPISCPLPDEPEHDDDEHDDDERDDAGSPTTEQPSQAQLDLLCYDPREFSIHHYYFKSEGVFFRLDRPALACLPTAA